MRAVIYSRYSTDLQSDASIEDQVRICKARIEREGWTCVDVYADHAISGATRLRPGYQKLLEDARKGGFDVIIAEALDRLSRDQEDVAGIYKQLCFADIKLVTLAEGEISELHVGLKGTMNALFLKDLAAKTWRGLEGRVRQGRSGGGNAYGYDVVREVDGNGERIRGGRTINKAEAALVRRIFAEFAAGRSPRAVAKALNAESLLGPGGRPWSDTTIRGHHARRTGVLRNDLYAGRLVWNKQRYVKDPRTGRRLARPNPRDRWLVQEVPELRIVDPDLWAKVQARLDAIGTSPGVEKARARKFWLNRRPRHLLTGIVVCGVCGTPFTSVGSHYLACGASHRQGTCANRRSIPRQALEGLILEALKRNLMAPELVEEFMRAFQEETNSLRREQELGGERLKREFEQVNRKLAGLIDAIADGLRTPGLKQKLDELERRKAALEEAIAAAPEPQPRLHPNLAAVYRRKVENLHEALADPATRDEAFGILRGLTERVVMYPIEKGYEIELVGEIANMVALAAEAAPKSKTAALGGAAVPDRFRSSVKVVAGTCNQRYLQLVEARM